MVRREKPCFRLRTGDSRLQAPDQLHPIILAVVESIPVRRDLRLHGDRYIEVWDAAELDALESGLHDTHNRHRLVIHQQALVQQARVATESPFPEAVAQHDDGIRSRTRRIVGRENSSDRRADAEHIEEISGNEVGAGALRLSPKRDTDRSAKLRGQPGKDGVVIA